MLNPMIPNHEALAMAIVAKRLKKGRYPLGLNEEKRNKLSTATTLEEVVAVSESFGKEAAQQAEVAYITKMSNKAESQAQKDANRALYLIRQNLIVKLALSKEDKEMVRFAAEQDLAAQGLGEHVNMRLGSTEPAFVRIINQLPNDEWGRKQQINPERWNITREEGIQVSGARLGWNEASPFFKALVKAFPSAIDFRSYNHSCAAPLLPGGYMPEEQVVLGCLKSIDETGKEIPMGDDGSGRYHPATPALQALVSKYGAVPFQVRAINPETGLFAKGIIVPDYRSVNPNGDPCITFSWLQVKGAHKATAKKLHKEGRSIVRKMDLGILRAWNKTLTIGMGFEVLENIQVRGPNKELNEARRLSLATNLKKAIEQDMEKFCRGGIEAILESLAKDDQTLDGLARLIGVAQTNGLNIDPLSIDRISDAIRDRLGCALYEKAQGSTVEGIQAVIVMDNGVPEGKAVVYGVPAGRKFACWRFPMVLAQGLLTLESMDPLYHHIVNHDTGLTVPQAIFMNPKDVLKMQGDDDGDIVGYSTAPLALEMFANLNDDRLFAIEPKGEAMKLDTLSPEGRSYIENDPMGPVGFFTIMRSSLLTCGDIMGALAMSVLIQEAIDQAKRKVRFSSWEAASNITNWKKVGDWYYLHPDGEPDRAFRDQDPDYSASEDLLKVVSKWVMKRVETVTGDKVTWIEGRPMDWNPLSWRKKGKRVDPLAWESTTTLQEGFSKRLRNAVHFNHDTAVAAWRAIAPRWNKGTVKQDIVSLLPTLLKLKGFPISEQALQLQPWALYKEGLRKTSGIEEYRNTLRLLYVNRKMQENGEILTADDPAEASSDRRSSILFAQQKLVQDLRGMVETHGWESLVTVWVHELTPTFKVGSSFVRGAGDGGSQVNSPNQAFSAIIWPGSPIMAMLGIENEEPCQFTSISTAKQVATDAVNHPEPSKLVADWIHDLARNKAHFDASGIPLHQCPSCTDALRLAYLSKWRLLKGDAAKKWVGSLVGRLNSGDRPYVDAESYTGYPRPDATKPFEPNEAPPPMEEMGAWMMCE